MSRISLYTMKDDKQDFLELASILKKEENPVVFATAIRVLRQNWRQGTVGCKSRGEVAFSGKKPWRQKGTGRIFGPQARTRTLALSQSQRALAMNNVFFVMLEASKISCVDYIVEQDVPRTKVAMNVLKKMGLDKKKVLLFMQADDHLLFAAFRNIPSVRILFFDDPNVYDLSHADHWVFLKNDVEHFNTMVARWN
jgi:large subunit ribosomal protein L4